MRKTLTEISYFDIVGFPGVLWAFPGRLTGKESVEFHQKLEVDIVALRSLAMAVSHMMAIEVDT
jgi:hypothetical protein